MPTTTTHPSASTAAPARPAAPRVRDRGGETASLTGIDAACRILHLPTIRERYDEILAAAEREQASYAAFLAEVLLAECDDRDERRRVRRVREAAFPRRNHPTSPATSSTPTSRQSRLRRSR